MRSVWLQCTLGVAMVVAAACLPSCMHERKLVQIKVQPSDASFGSPAPDAQIIFTALGSYIHPPDTRDITDKATWKSDVPQLVTVTGGVVSPTGNGCGVADISASMNDGGNLLIGYATVTVKDPTNTNCPGGGNTTGVITVTLGGTAAGTVTSVPAGITCPSVCGAEFTVGNTVVLTATPTTNHTFTGWTNCPSGNTGDTCSIQVPSGSLNVTASFN